MKLRRIAFAVSTAFLVASMLTPTLAHAEDGAPQDTKAKIVNVIKKTVYRGMPEQVMAIIITMAFMNQSMVTFQRLKETLLCTIYLMMTGACITKAVIRMALVWKFME